MGQYIYIYIVIPSVLSRLHIVTPHRNKINGTEEKWHLQNETGYASLHPPNKHNNEPPSSHIYFFHIQVENSKIRGGGGGKGGKGGANDMMDR